MLEVAGTAQRAVLLGFAEHDLLLTRDEAVGVVRPAPTAYADRVDLVYRVSYSTELRHRAERLATEVHIQSSEDDADPLVCQLLDDLGEVLIEELCLVDADDVDV